jgi:hypothetical protein
MAAGRGWGVKEWILELLEYEEIWVSKERVPGGLC